MEPAKSNASERWQAAAHQARQKNRTFGQAIFKMAKSFTSVDSVSREHRRVAAIVYVVLVLIWIAYCVWMCWSLANEYKKFVTQTAEISEDTKEMPALLLCFNHFTVLGSPKYTFREASWKCSTVDPGNGMASVGGPCTVTRYTGNAIDEALFPRDGCVIFNPHSFVADTVQTLAIEAQWEGRLDLDQHQMFAAVFLDPNFHDDDIQKAVADPVYLPFGRHSYCSLEKISWVFANGYSDFSYTTEWQDNAPASVTPKFLQGATPLAAGNAVTGTSLFVRYRSMNTLANTEVRSSDLQSTITLAISSAFSTYTTIVSAVFTFLFVPALSEELFFVIKAYMRGPDPALGSEGPPAAGAPSPAAAGLAPPPVKAAPRTIDLDVPPSLGSSSGGGDLLEPHAAPHDHPGPLPDGAHSARGPAFITPRTIRI